MRRLLLTFALAVVLGLGFYLNWFSLSARGEAATAQVHLMVEVNHGKIGQEAQQAQVPKEAVALLGAAPRGDVRAKGELIKLEQGDNRLTIRTSDNKTLTFVAEATTKIRRNGVDVNLDSLTEGDHVLVLYREANGKNIAQAVTVKPGTE